MTLRFNLHQPLLAVCWETQHSTNFGGGKGRPENLIPYFGRLPDIHFIRVQNTNVQLLEALAHMNMELCMSSCLSF